jgi:hypothetical protein
LGKAEAKNRHRSRLSRDFAWIVSAHIGFSVCSSGQMSMPLRCPSLRAASSSPSWAHKRLRVDEMFAGGLSSGENCLHAVDGLLLSSLSTSENARKSKQETKKTSGSPTRNAHIPWANCLLVSVSSSAPGQSSSDVQKSNRPSPFAEAFVNG